MFWGVKRPGSDAAHSPSSIAEAKTEWICTYTPQCAFVASTWSTLPLQRSNEQLVVAVTHGLACARCPVLTQIETAVIVVQVLRGVR